MVTVEKTVAPGSGSADAASAESAQPTPPSIGPRRPPAPCAAAPRRGGPYPGVPPHDHESLSQGSSAAAGLACHASRTRSAFREEPRPPSGRFHTPGTRGSGVSLRGALLESDGRRIAVREHRSVGTRSHRSVTLATSITSSLGSDPRSRPPSSSPCGRLAARVGEIVGEAFEGSLRIGITSPASRGLSMPVSFASSSRFSARHRGSSPRSTRGRTRRRDRAGLASEATHRPRASTVRLVRGVGQDRAEEAAQQLAEDLYGLGRRRRGSGRRNSRSLVATR